MHVLGLKEMVKLRGGLDDIRASNSYAAHMVFRLVTIYSSILKLRSHSQLYSPHHKSVTIRTHIRPNSTFLDIQAIHHRSSDD